SNSCFSIQYGYKCCTDNKVVFTDESGRWGVENGEWCGISDDFSDSCFSVPHGFPCCELCSVLYTDQIGKWGVENGEWCGIKDSCFSDPVPSNIDFDFSFLKMENNKENMLYSPLSIKYALSMLKEGAVNDTYTEINNVIGNTELTKYTNIDKILSLANGIFIRKKFYKYVIPDYVETLKEKYNAEVIQDDFSSAYNANKWIENKTLGIIKNILSDKVVQDPETVILLINALAIDMTWYRGFGYKNTYGGVFHIDDDQTMIATMMYKKEVRSRSDSYYMDDDITVVTMDLDPYQNVQFEFMAIMPMDNLSTYIDNISKEEINQIDKKLKLSSDEPYGINIKIPKFKFTYDLNLMKDLNDLGIKRAFNKTSAEFSKIAYEDLMEQKPYVSKAIHRADIEFSEDGIKAAAVTIFVVNGVPKSLPPPPSYPIDVIIDRSFMFIIRDKNTKEIWFTGTVYEPNKWEDDKSEY
ncbi:Non-catalytic module family DOC2, partial [Piromyces sp. E2]